MIQTRSENFTSLNLSLTPRQQEQRELWEPPLSNEVLVLIKEDECGVCDNLQLSSEVVAHGHYHGRKHEKRLLKMLADKGGEVPKKKGCIVAENSAWHQSLMNPLRCELCKVDLNGPSTASLHYSGAKHQKRLNQVNNMAEFNMEVENEEEQEDSMVDNTFGIGVAFHQLAEADLQHREVEALQVALELQELVVLPAVAEVEPEHVDLSQPSLKSSRPRR